MKKRMVCLGVVCLSVLMLTACDSGTAPAGSENDDRPRYSGEEEEEEEGVFFLDTDISVSGSITPLVSGNVIPVDPVTERDIGSGPSDNVAKGEELMAFVFTEEEAKEIADLYGIELVLYDQGVATYHTDEDPSEVIKRGRDNGWHSLTVNTIDKPE